MAEACSLSQAGSCDVNGEDDELERLAIEELVNEAKRAKERSKTMGAYGWQKRKATTNKRFLHSTLVSTLREYKTNCWHCRKSSGLDSRMTESKWSKYVHNDQSSKSAEDTASRCHRISQSRREPGDRDDNERTTGGAMGPNDTGEDCARREGRNVSHMSKEPVRPHNPHDDHSNRKGKHKSIHTGTSLTLKGYDNAHHHDRRRGHYEHRKKSKSKKHKHKHKDRFSGLKRHKCSKRSRRCEESLHESPLK